MIFNLTLLFHLKHNIMKKLHFLSVFILLLFVCVNVQAQSPCVMSYEPNETLDNAYWLNGLDGVMYMSIQAGIDNVYDADFYRAQISTPGSSVRITLKNLPKSYGMIVYYQGGFREKPILLDYKLDYGTSDKTFYIPSCNSGGVYTKVFSPFGEYDENRCYTLEINISSNR